MRSLPRSSAAASARSTSSPGGAICFVEVKLRSDRRFGLPRDFVTTAKQRRIRTTAAFYMTRHDPDLCARFDVAEVYDDETPPRIEYIENAFE